MVKIPSRSKDQFFVHFLESSYLQPEPGIKIFKFNGACTYKKHKMTAAMVWPKMGITLGLSLLLALSLSSGNVWAKPLLDNDVASPFKSSFKYSFFHRAASASMVSAVAAQKLSEGATDTLTVSIPLSQSPTLQEGRDGPLMRDINMLTDILGDLVKQENPKVHTLYEEFLELGVER
jgi:hypothetical protein